MNLHGMHEIVVSGHDCLCVVRGMCYITTQGNVKVKLSSIWRVELMQVWEYLEECLIPPQTNDIQITNKLI